MTHCKSTTALTVLPSRTNSLQLIILIKPLSGLGKALCCNPRHLGFKRKLWNKKKTKQKQNNSTVFEMHIYSRACKTANIRKDCVCAEPWCSRPLKEKKQTNKHNNLHV